MKRLAAVLAALLLCLAMPVLASAQLGPQNVPAPLTQTDSDPDTVKVDEDTGTSTFTLVLIFGAAIAGVALVAWFIMRDARHAAPVAAGRRAAAERDAAPKAPTKSARERERELARKRNKAKAARNQRKKNRPR